MSAKTRNVLRMLRNKIECDGGKEQLMRCLKQPEDAFLRPSTNAKQASIRVFFGASAGALTLSKATDKEYGLAVKLLLVCATCEFEKKQFSTPRVAGTAKITSFEVNMRAMKGIQSIGKGVTALADLYCVRAALEPVFARLSDENLLARCSEGKRQNASESLHSVIWTQTSKNANASLDRVKRAAAEAVAVYNQGRWAMNESFAAILGYAAGDCLVRRSMEKDNLRLRRAKGVHQGGSNAKQRFSRQYKTETAGDYSPGQLRGGPPFKCYTNKGPF
ncbi:hypothetical protein HPB47_019881 [Ixodes persulcatus]|uniref:Uncharacterized protein n=1 Tax=Ixodes persulcatus TaxID=34615 RepID=A0AC60QH07_IXOPE|nr:hypothetical protein HPB47_019881 [Ixodes persulcatus]